MGATPLCAGEVATQKKRQRHDAAGDLLACDARNVAPSTQSARSANAFRSQSYCVPLILKSIALGGERRPALEVAAWENDKGIYAKQDWVPKGLEGVCIPSTRTPTHHRGTMTVSINRGTFENYPLSVAFFSLFKS